MAKMKKIIIDVQRYSDKKKEKVFNKLSWYNDVTKKVEYFEGGKLNFKYKKDVEMQKRGYKNPYRLLPEVEDIYKTKEIKLDNIEKIVEGVLSGSGRVLKSDGKKIEVVVDERNYGHLRNALRGNNVYFRDA